MMYNEKLVFALKAHGKVLREFKDTVYVPFGSEYSILIKNLNSVRALVKVSIDGQYVDETGAGFVVSPNDNIELERFVKNGNLSQGNHFKFIERTEKIEQHRGVGGEDGLVRVEFQYEKRVPVQPIIVWHPAPVHYFIDPNPYFRSYDVKYTHDSHHGSNEIKCKSVFSDNQFIASCSSTEPLMASNDVGITVPGSVSTQQFVLAENFPLETESYVMVLRLLGETLRGKRVNVPISVKTKQKCPTCGHTNKANVKFCAECGTGLEIV